MRLRARAAVAAVRVASGCDVEIAGGTGDGRVCRRARLQQLRTRGELRRGAAEAAAVVGRRREGAVVERPQERGGVGNAHAWLNPPAEVQRRRSP